MNRLAVSIGQLVRGERQRRRWSLRALAGRARISIAHLCEIEAGLPASLETYARLFTALDLPLELATARRDQASERRGQDLVHAAMGEIEAARLGSFGFGIRIDEPYQHYQFAGRADLAAWDLDARSLLHIENRTQFPNVQEALGSYGAKRTYLGRVLADRLGIRGGWASETHVIAALWSSEVLHTVRLRAATFLAACPDRPDAFGGWWAGNAPTSGVASSLVLFDPAPGLRESFRFREPNKSTRPRYRGYADAAEVLRGSQG